MWPRFAVKPDRRVTWACVTQASISFWAYIRNQGEESLPFTFEEFFKAFLLSVLVFMDKGTSFNTQKNATSFPLVKSQLRNVDLLA